MYLDPTKWYAVHTRSNFESKAYQHLCGKSINTLLPRIQVMSRRRDRRKKIFVPLFPGYLFVNVDLTPESHLEILKSVGVVRLVGFEGRPVPVNPEEISNVMILDGTDQPVQNLAYLKRGDLVRITEGPLEGLVGIYLHHKSRADRLVVSVEFLKRSVAVEIDGWSVERVS